MTPTYFSPAELKCRCRRPDCDAVAVQPHALGALIAVRIDWSHPLFISSASRCARHNKAVGGAPDSQHLIGLAFDVMCSDSNQVQVLATLAEKHGFRGIGTGKRLLHIDIREGPKAHWAYNDR